MFSLANPHLQTIWAQKLRREALPRTLESSLLQLPDGRLTGLLSTPLPAKEGTVLIVPGLGGSMASTYIRAIINALTQHRLRAVFIHTQRGRTNPLGLHAGDTEALDYIINSLVERVENTPLATVGYSLGGATLLNWLAWRGASAPVQAAIAVSVPFDLEIAERRLRQGFSRVYQRYLLNCQKQLVLRCWPRASQPGFREALQKVRCFAEFDDLVTAPMHGFQSAADYYARCSPRHGLASIRKPTLLIHAEDDPFLTPEAIPRRDELAPQVELELHRHGGHVGFVQGLPWRPRYWLEERIPRFLNEVMKTSTMG